VAWVTVVVLIGLTGLMTVDTVWPGSIGRLLSVFVTA
jgi:hypothetical protein